MFKLSDIDLDTFRQNNNLDLPHYEEGKSPFEMMEAQTAFIEQTSKELHTIADSANAQSESAKEIAESSKTQSELAVKTSGKADIKGWVAVIISALAFIWSIISHFI